MSKGIILLNNYETAVPFHISDQDIIAATRTYRLGDGFCCWLDHMSGKQNLPGFSEEEYAVVTFWPNNPYNDRRAQQRDLSVEQYVEWAFGEILRRQTLMKDHFFWCIGWETFQVRHWCLPDGSPPIFKSRKEGFDFFKKWLTTSLNTKHYRNTLKFGEARFNRRPCALEYLAQRKIPRSDINIVVGNTDPEFAHYTFAAVPETRMFWWECCITKLNLQVGFTYVRGAAKQYQKKWLVDASPFAYPYPIHDDRFYADLGEWGVIEQGEGQARLNYPKYTADMTRLAGFTPEIMLRCWLAALLSGCDFLFQEASSATHFTRTDKRLELTPFGQAARQLAEFMRRLDDRGTTLAPVALLMDFHHGMNPGSGRKPWGYAPRAAGDNQISDLFEKAYPGHSRQALPWPWQNEKQYARMLRAGYDFRPHEPRLLCNGRWPDVFDVFLSNAPGNVYSDKQLILLVGNHDLTVQQESLLLELTGTGRDAVVFMGQMRPEAAFLDGITFMEKEEDAYQAINPLSGTIIEEARYRIRVIRAEGWQIRLQTEAGSPLLLEKSYGGGRRFFCTCPYGLNTDQMLLSSIVQLLDTLIDNLVPFRLIGPPIQRIINKTEQGYILALINNSPAQWWGEMEGKNVTPSSVSEKWENKAVVWQQSAAGCRFCLAVPAFCFRIVEICC